MEEKKKIGILIGVGIAIFAIIIGIVMCIMPSKYFGEWTSTSKDEYQYASSYSNFKLILNEDTTFKMNGNATMYILGKPISAYNKYEGTYSYFGGKITLNITKKDEKSTNEKMIGTFNNDKLTLKATIEGEDIYYEFKK